MKKHMKHAKHPAPMMDPRMMQAPQRQAPMQMPPPGAMGQGPSMPPGQPTMGTGGMVNPNKVKTAPFINQ